MSVTGQSSLPTHTLAEEIFELNFLLGLGTGEVVYDAIQAVSHVFLVI